MRFCGEEDWTHVARGVATVFDDRSTDPETSTVLKKLEREDRIRVLTPQVKGGAADDLAAAYGGLYRNMQSFLDTHANSTWALFLQDDTQVVRTLTSLDLDHIESIFSNHPQTAFVYPAFLTYRELYDHVDLGPLRVAQPSYTFVRDYEFSGYFDVCLAYVGRLRSAKWRFVSELATSLSARERFGPMRLMRQPFVAHLPSPPTYRDSRQTWTQRLWEHYRAGIYPVDPLSDLDVREP